MGSFSISKHFIREILKKCINSDEFLRCVMMDTYYFDIYMSDEEYENLGLERIRFSLTMNPSEAIMKEIVVNNYYLSSLQLYGSTDVYYNFKDLGIGLGLEKGIPKSDVFKIDKVGKTEQKFLLYELLYVLSNNHYDIMKYYLEKNLLSPLILYSQYDKMLSIITEERIKQNNLSLKYDRLCLICFSLQDIMDKYNEIYKFKELTDDFYISLLGYHALNYNDYENMLDMFMKYQDIGVKIVMSKKDIDRIFGDDLYKKNIHNVYYSEVLDGI